MKSCKIAIAAVLACAAAGSLAQIAGSTDPHAFSAQDRKFLNEIGQSTLAEVALGKLAAQKGTTPSVRLFGRWMASTDSLANRQLAIMTKEMNGPTLPANPTAEQQAEFLKMQALSGTDFDREYIQMMVPGHNAEIALFQQQVERGQNPSVRSFARNLLPTAREHLAAVEDLIATTKSK